LSYINDLISDFSIEQLKLFFSRKITNFKPIPEYYDFLFEENEVVPKHYENIIKIGEADLANNDDLLVITAQTNEPLTNRTGKKRQYEIAKKILKEENKDAAFFIFYDENNNFRFSFIRANFLGTKRDFTEFKRYTYFVSKTLTNKTFINQISKADFNDLNSIQEAFNVEPLTKQFYEKLQHWYFWAIENVKFPDDAEEKNGRENAIIRLITRLMFIWFMKVRNLIPYDLFDEDNINKILVDSAPEESTYYKAILQNLFFATLNTEQKERKFRSETRGPKGNNSDFGNHNVFRYHDLFKDSESIKTLFGQIPFLNGGLFECLDYKTKEKEERKYIDGFTATKGKQPIVPNFLFFSEPQKKDISKFYEKKNKTYKVEGLINLLKSYNFTIDENEADDIEVALDPELLGSIFENLLASYNPETATTARKATGSFYTPREIVNYMTNESLKQYFITNLKVDSSHETDTELEKKLDSLIKSNNSENPFDTEISQKITKLINDLRVVDPAVGSGAFPMAVLNKLVFILAKLDPNNIFWEQTQLDGTKNIPDPKSRKVAVESIKKKFKEKNADYGRKLYLIEKCIYGVDIQQIAVEIAKLRFFISLLVDEKIEWDKPEKYYGIEPLPNLDFKLMQGNSLISSFAGINFDKPAEKTEDNLFDMDEPNTELISKFEELKNEYQNEYVKEKKDDLRDKIEKCIFEIVEDKIMPQLRSIEEKYANLPNGKILENAKTKTYTTKEQIISNEKMKLAKELGFDIEQIEKDLNAFTDGRKPKDFFLWKVYFAEVFSQKGGFDIVIGNPPYVEHKKLKHIAKKLKPSYKVYTGSSDLSVYFFEKGFNLLKENGTLSYISTNKFFNTGYGRSLRKYLLTKKIYQIINFEQVEVFEGVLVSSVVFISENKTQIEEGRFKFVEFKKEKNWKSTFDKKLCEREKQYHQSIFNDSEWVFLNSNEASLKKKIEANGKIVREINGIEIKRGVTTGYDPAFIIDVDTKILLHSVDIIKPLLLGRDIKKYKKKFNNRFLINSHNGSRGKNDRINLERDYSIVYDYLIKFNEKNSNKVKTRTDKGEDWTNLRNCAFLDLFDKEKIIWPLTADKWGFTIDKNKHYLSSGGFFMVSSKYSLKVILALLNSKLLEYYFRFIGVMTAGGAYTLKKSTIEYLPICFPKNNKHFETLVDKIITKKKLGEDTKELEDKIDLMVYKLYKLTYDEVKIIDSEFWLSKKEYENYENKE